MTKPLTIAVLVAVLTSLCTRAQAQEATRVRRFELGVAGGPVFTWSPETMPISGGGSLDFRASWPFGQVVRVGFRLGMLATSIPHGEAEYEGRPGEGTFMVASFLPTLRFLLAFDVTSYFAIEGCFGLGFLESTRGFDEGWFAIPTPQAGIGATFRLWRGPKADLLLRAQVDVDDYDPGDGIAFIVPMVGLSASF